MKKTLVLMAAGLMLSSAAMADTGFYAGAELGAATIKNQAQTLANGLVNKLSGSASVTQDTGIGFGRLYGGYQFHKMVAGELGYVQSGDAKANFSGTTGGGAAYTGNVTLNYSGLDASAVIKPFEKAGLNGLFFRAGLTNYEQKTVVAASANGASASGTSVKSGTGTMLGVGYDLSAGPGVVRFQLNALQSVAGISDNDTTAISAGYLIKF